MKLKQHTSPYLDRIFSQLIVGCLVSIAVAACSNDKRVDTNGAAAKLGNVVSLSSISGTSGPKAGGGKLSLVGQGFMPGAKVLMGSNECTEVSVVSTGVSASCTIPAGELGRVSVSLTNPDAQSAHLADAYEYRLAPKISAISPNIIPAAGGSTLTISGENFDSDAKVIIGQASCSPVVVSSASSLSCTSLPMTAGTYGVTVSNHDEQSVKLDNILSIVPALAPTLSTVAPSFGPIAGGTEMTISGANFISGAVVTVGGSICAKTSFVSAQSLVCTTPSGATGYKDVVVSNPDLQTGTLAKAFAFSNGSAPLVASVSPIYALATGGTVISISGAGFLKGATITVGNAGCGSVVFDSQSSLTCTLGASSAGIKDLKVTNPDGQLATLSNGFTYSTGLPPSVSSILPNYGPLSGGTTVVISGSGIMMGASVSLGGVACTSVNIISSSSLSCSTGVGTYGAKNVVITNPDTLVGTLTNGFTYSNGLAPTVASIAPNYGPAAGGTSLTITGSGFMSGATVTIGGASCASVSYNSSSSLSCVTPAGSYGVKAVVVTNPDTLMASPSTTTTGFTYSNGLAPTISSISPLTGPIAGGTSLTITGSQFMSGAAVTIGGVSCSSVTVNSATSITCITPAGSYGAKAVVVTNADNQTATSTVNFTYQTMMQPTISLVSPNSGLVTGGTSLTITGSGFLSGMTIAIGGITCSSPVVVNTSMATCVAPAGTVGAKTVNVYNPDLQTNSLSNAYTYTLTTQAKFTLLGSEDDARFGRSVLSLGDITGDGKPEFAVGEPYATVSGTVQAGAVYVYNGSTGAIVCTLVSPSPVTGGNFGFSLAAGEMNGSDTKAELVVGEPRATATGSVLGAGRVHVYSGAAINTCSSSPLNSVVRTLEAVSPVADANFGYSVATGLIVGSDALLDIIVGEPFATPANLTFSGNTTNASTGITAIASTTGAFAGFGITGTGIPAGATISAVPSSTTLTLSSAATATNAGTSLTILQPLAQGRVTVFNGSSGAVAYTLTSPLPVEGGNYGFSVAALDMNGDGVADIAIGEPGATNTGIRAGRVHVFNGSTGVLLTNGTITLGDVTAESRFGYSISNGGLINFDSRADLVIGEPYMTTGAGKAFVVSYTAASAMSAIYTITPTAESNSNFGLAVSGAGDVDGDGRADFMIAQPYIDSNGVAGTDRGRIIMYSGFTGFPLFTINGGENNALLGRAIAPAGDIDGDGYADIIYGEPNSANSGTGQGKVTVFLAP